MGFWEEVGSESIVEHCRKFLRADFFVSERSFIFSSAKYFGVSEDTILRSLRKAEELEYESDRGEILHV